MPRVVCVGGSNDAYNAMAKKEDREKKNAAQCHKGIALKRQELRQIWVFSLLLWGVAFIFLKNGHGEE